MIKTNVVINVGYKFVFYNELPNLDGELFVFTDYVKGKRDQALYSNKELRIKTLIFENQVSGIIVSGEFPKRIRLFKHADVFRVAAE